MKATIRMTQWAGIALLCAACSPATAPDVATPAATAPPPAEAPATMSPPATAPEAAPSAMQQQALMAKATVAEATARATALSKVPGGTIVSSELEEEHALLIWSFDIAKPGSKDIVEIQVDAKTGDITSTQVETPKDQAREAAADAQQKP